MDSKIFEVEKSCQKLKTAWRAVTMSSTTARARLDGDGGLPRGLQERKQMTDATRRSIPKPPRTYFAILSGQFLEGGVMAFLPNFLSRRSI